MALTEAQISELHAILVAPVTDFDCGTLCAPENGGVPVCCHAQTILPVLYTAEFAVLERRTQLWSRYAPRNDGEREMAAAMRPCETFGICKGRFSGRMQLVQDGGAQTYEARFRDHCMIVVR